MVSLDLKDEKVLGRVREALVRIKKDQHYKADKTFGEALGVSGSHINLLINGARGTTELFVRQLCWMFGLQRSYFAGETDELYQRPRENIGRMINVITKVLQVYRLDPLALAHKLGFEEHYIEMLLAGTKFPAEATITNLKLVYNVDPDYCHGKSDTMFLPLGAKDEGNIKAKLIAEMIELLADSPLLGLLEQFVEFLKSKKEG